MRFGSLMLLLVGLFISGCAGHSVDCTLGVGNNDCAPGTKGYEEMEQKQQDAKTIAEINDARCQVYGARGTPGYSDCRRRAAKDQSLSKPSQ